MGMTVKAARKVANESATVWHPEAVPRKRAALWTWTSGVIMGAALSAAIISAGAMVAIEQAQRGAECSALDALFAAVSGQPR